VHALGDGYDEKDIDYYFLDVSEIGNGNTGNIHLYVDNGSECRNNTNDQCRANTERPVRVKRELIHNMQKSYCAFDSSEPVRVILNYPSRPLADNTDNRNKGYITGNLNSQVFNYDYEGVSGTSIITIQKLNDSGNPVGAPQVISVSSTVGSAQPIITYDDNGIGSVSFDFTDDGSRTPSFKWTYENGASGAGKYHFTWVFNGDNPTCQMTTEWDVYVVNKSDAFSIWRGKTWNNAVAGEVATYPTTWAEVQNLPAEEKALNYKEWFDTDANGVPTTLHSDRVPQIPLCWKSAFEDGQTDPANIISFLPNELVGNEVPGEFWIQELKDENGIDREIPTSVPVGGVVVDDVNKMIKVCKDNFPGELYISDYAIYTNTLDPDVSDYRILYYVGCGQPFSRRIKIDNGSSVTIAVDNEQNGGVCTTKTGVDPETGALVSSYNPYVMIHAKGTAINNGKFYLGDELEGLLYDPTNEGLGKAPNCIPNPVTSDNEGQVAYLNLDLYREKLKKVDRYKITIYYEYTAGNCVYRSSKLLYINDFAEVKFTVGNVSADTQEKRLYCAADVESYPLVTEHPTLKDGSLVPGSGWFEITMQGSATGNSYGLYYVEKGKTIKDAVKVTSDDITNQVYNDNDGTFYFRPGALSPAVYTINYIFKSDEASYGGCYQTKMKQYFVAPRHLYQGDEVVEYCPNYVSTGDEGDATIIAGSVQTNWANNPFAGDAYDVFTPYLKFKKQDLEQKDFGYYEFKIYHASNATINYDLEITSSQTDDIYTDSELALMVKDSKTNKIEETAVPSDGWVVKAKLPVTYLLASDGSKLYVQTISGNELYDRKTKDQLEAPEANGLQKAVVDESCEIAIAKFTPIKKQPLTFDFVVDNTCSVKDDAGNPDDQKTGKVTLVQIHKGDTDIAPAADGKFSYQWYFYTDQKNATNTNNGQTGADGLTNPMAGTTFTYEKAQKGYYILKVQDNDTKCFFKSDAQEVKTLEPVDFVVDVRERYDCGFGSTKLGQAAIKFNGTAPTTYTVIWKKGSGEVLPVTSTIISDLEPGKYSAQVYSGSNESCSNVVEFQILPLPEYSSSSTETAVSCKGGMDGTTTVSFSHLADVPAKKDPDNKTNNYADYKAFDDKVMFLIASASDVVTSAAAGWREADTYKTEGDYDIASLSLTTKVKFEPNPATFPAADGQLIQTDKLQISNLKAGNYTVWFKYGNYDACLYSYDFTITEPDDDIQIVRTSAEDISCNGSENGAIQVTAMRGGKQTTNFGDLAGNYLYTLTPLGGTEGTPDSKYRFEGLKKGTYTLKVYDKAATGQQTCSVSKEISIYEPGVVNFAQPVFDPCAKTVRTNISGHWNQVAAAENPRNHTVKLEVSLWDENDKMVGDWTEVADGVDQTFGVNIDALTEPKTYKAKWRTTWVNAGDYTVDGNPKDYTCDGWETVTIAPYISASITKTVDFLCADNTLEKGKRSEATITAQAVYGGDTHHFYKLYKVTEEETSPGSGVYKDVLTLVTTASEKVGDKGTSTHTFTLASGNAGDYVVTVFNGSTDNGTCSATTQKVTIAQPDNVRIEAEQIIADNGTNSGKITIKPIEGGHNPYSWKWTDSDKKGAYDDIHDDDVLGAKNANPISGLSVRDDKGNRLNEKYFAINVKDNKGCTISQEFRVFGNSLQVDKTVTHNSCHGDENGVIALTITGKAPYSIYLGGTVIASNVAPTDPADLNVKYDITGLRAGKYKVSVKDANGVTVDLDEIEIKDLSTMQPGDVKSNLCEAGKGFITAKISGGATDKDGKANYHWYAFRNGNKSAYASDVLTDDPDAQIELKNLSEGTYKIVVYDFNSVAKDPTTANTCFVEFPEVVLTQFHFAFNVTQPQCETGDKGAIEVVTTNAIGDLTYE
ncbi:MAG: hypothetical protein PUJ24_10355, partial [Bacteroidales bacterium]|nr:hypothetical protein [Bacteroidales bacterium]